MHPRNRHKNRYELQKLAKVSPKLVPYIFTNEYGAETIDFSNQDAVLALNQALLKSFYNVSWWEIPKLFLCPPIPGRADYIHTVSDLFTKKQKLHVLDIGVGANCIYPLIGHHEYQWTFVGADVNRKALTCAEKIIEKNHLQKSIELRLQKDPEKIFTNIIGEREKFDLVICNPPFHASKAEAEGARDQKWKKLGAAPTTKQNFGGSRDELWYPGGERSFITKMIRESSQFRDQVVWFSTLVSQEKNLFFLEKKIEAVKAKAKVLKMDQGQKKSRILAWSFNL